MNDLQKAVLVKLMLKGWLVSHHAGDNGCESVYIYKSGKFIWIDVDTEGRVI
jgi:hypothetical protein